MKNIRIIFLKEKFTMDNKQYNMGIYIKKYKFIYFNNFKLIYQTC